MRATYDQMRKISIVFLVFSLIYSPYIPGASSFKISSSTVDGDSTELHLLRVEHYLELEAKDITDAFSVKYVFPPDYGYQVPILLEVFNDSTAEILHYQIEGDTNEPNRVVNFTVNSLQKDEHVLLHFTIWVLVENHEFEDLPEDAPLPHRYDLPEETTIWLKSTDVVQAKRVIIKLKAKQLQGKNDNLLSFAKNVSHFIKYHHYFLFLIELKLGLFLNQDAMTTFFINGENVGRSHLACALFRSQNIPSRVILANNDQGFWTQMHYMVEYYFPKYGWVLLDSTKGETPYATRRQVINRICYPDDEEDTKRDYIFPFMKGEERWIWIDTDRVQPYYVDCDEGSKSQMFQEMMLTVDSFSAEYSFFRTRNVFHQYEKFFGMNLSSENTEHLQQAIHYQKQAITKLIETEDIHEYIYFIEKAFDEYKAIDIS